MNALAVLSAFAVCWFTLASLLSRRHALPMDHPNARSLHRIPTPRVGGLGILGGIAVSALWIAPSAFVPVMLGAFMLAGLSLVDDLRGLPVWIRFLAHLVAAAGCLNVLGVVGWSLVYATIAVVWMTNLNNFMDGADGLAGGMAMIGFGALAVAARLDGEVALATLCAAIAAAALAFLRFNFPPARVFMGDAGSIPLGFLAALLGIYGARQGIWPWWYPVAVFSPFIVDASVTLVKRVLRREKFWQAHNEHYYQRLIQLGWGHRKTALAEYALMLSVGILAYVMLSRSAAWQVGFIFLLAVLYATLAITIDARWRRRHVTRKQIT